MMRTRITLCAIFTGLGTQFPVWSQETRGTILGRVTDQTGSVIPAAQVVARNVNTGVVSSAITSSTGDYTLTFLIPGEYSVRVEAPGFKSFVRNGIPVRVSDRIAVNAVMELGQNTESIEVVGAPPLVDTSTASMGQVIDNKTILELPLKDGMVLMMAIMAPGVMNLGTSTGYVRPFDTSNPSNISAGGTRTRSNSFTVDGSPNMQRSDVAYSPPPGVVEEFRIQTSTFDASQGFMPGATLNMSLKSGTNKLHGQTYYFHQNPVLNANQFFLNRAGQDRKNFRIHRWGANASGPVILPKVYNGTNKTFWMYGYEGIWSFDPSPFFVEAVPTPAQRMGDFSQLLAISPNYQIYDPYSIAPAANGRFSRQPLPNNIIPANQVDPVARNLARLWESPNQAGTNDGANNWQKGKNAQDSYYNHIFRVDQNVSEKQRLYVRAYFTLMDRPENIRHNLAVGDLFRRWNRGAGFDHVYTVSPTFIVNTRYSYTRFISAFDAYQANWDLAGEGFAQSYISQIEQVDTRAKRLPRIEPTGYAGLSDQTTGRQHSDIHDVQLNGTNLIGAHTLRWGTGYRAYRENNWNLNHSAGQLDFGTNWVRGPLDSSGSSPRGQGFASFMYGLPTDGYFPVRDSYAEQSTVLPLFVQDDWKVSNRLTVSLGLRYELHSPLTERFDRSVRGFDFSAASPVEAQAIANYARNPIPEVPISQFSARGGLNFAGVGGNPRTLWRTPKNAWMPRIGFAYSITPQTVFRAGYGIYIEPIGVTYEHVNQTGYSRDTDLVATIDNGLNFIGTLSNPFPNGFLQPAGASGGLVTNLGQSVSFFNEAIQLPYMQRWQAAIQRQLPGSSVLEVSYVGNRATKQRMDRQLNPVPREYLSTSPVRDQATINFLGQQVANPFYPLLPGTSLSGTTVSRSQLLRPFPQFTGVTMDTNQGYSWYHSMLVRFEKRFSHGFQSSVSFTWAKLMEARGYLNDTDPMPERVIAAQDRTNRLVWNWIWELPFGRNRAIGTNLPRAADAIVGGWQLMGIYSLQSGEPLGFGNAIFNGDLKAIPLSGSERSVDQWINVDAGFERNSRNALSQNLRTFPSRFSGIRSDIQNNWDLSAIKNVQITEGLRMQFRAEAINALNHPQFQAPNTTPTSSSFGRVTGEWSWARLYQFGLKFLF